MEGAARLSGGGPPETIAHVATPSCDFGRSGGQLSGVALEQEAMGGKLKKRSVVRHGESLVFYCSDEELSKFLEPRALDLMWFWKLRETDPNLAPEIKAAPRIARG